MLVWVLIVPLLLQKSFVFVVRETSCCLFLTRIRADIIEAFNSTSRYLDDLLNIYNPYFEQMVSQIYRLNFSLIKHICLILNPDFLNLALSITYGIVLSKNYNKRDDFNFEIVNDTFFDGDVPCAPSYGVYISQLNRFARILLLYGLTCFFWQNPTEKK